MEASDECADEFYSNTVSDAEAKIIIFKLKNKKHQQKLAFCNKVKNNWSVLCKEMKNMNRYIVVLMEFLLHF